MHESDKIGEGIDHAKQDLENAPENVANWTGEQVGRVEHTYDNAVDDVENFPENAARWTGDKVQAVEDIPRTLSISGITWLRGLRTLAITWRMRMMRAGTRGGTRMKMTTRAVGV
ncbi:hypothetical protein P3342_012241 [Pyrenophora teres f. teres]|nr:hypothetical protein P3342_012241 [Pyrenophora teres f. teres]